MEDVWAYPRPPAIERVTKRIVIEFAGRVVAQASTAYRVLETSHPPVYYLPPEAFSGCDLVPAPGSSFCEWKGHARYWTVVAGEHRAERAGWSYPEPAPPYAALRDHVAVYAGPMDSCSIDGERVTPQPGGFYGGWITSDVKGPFKGVPGSRGW